MMRTYSMAACLSAALVIAGPAAAALVPFQSYNGTFALSSDGFGSSSGNGVISAQAPLGSTVVAAFLYTATQNTSTVPSDVTLNGTPVSYSSTSANNTACCNLRSHRSDVTSIVSASINGGAGGVYDFNISEGNSNASIDGSALVVVYSNPTLPQASVGILDGFAAVTGDSTAINFSEPLDPNNPDFFAEMVLGISYSRRNQSSRITVNGSVLTENAGNFDDGLSEDIGSLITVGGFQDPFSASGASYADDTERYNLTSFIAPGDASITVDTFNASEDDNIFLAAFYVSGNAGFNAPPPDNGPSPNVIPLPASALMLLAGLAGLVGLRRSRAA